MNYAGFLELQAQVQAQARTIEALTAERDALPCGHPKSLLLRSAETGLPLYCELCDDKSGRRDAEQRERELTAERDALREDAERYRWLRDSSHGATVARMFRGEWDAYIDAARKDAQT